MGFGLHQSSLPHASNKHVLSFCNLVGHSFYFGFAHLEYGSCGLESMSYLQEKMHNHALHLTNTKKRFFFRWTWSLAYAVIIDMNRYHPSKAPDPDELLSIDESERIDLVQEGHVAVQIEFEDGAETMHAVMHVIVENVSLNWIQAAIACGFKPDSYSASNMGLPVRI